MPLLQPHPLVDEDFAIEPEPWTVDKSVRHFPVELPAEPFSGLWPLLDPVLDPMEELDPVAAGPALVDLPAADWMPAAQSLPDPGWDAPTVRMQDASRPVRIGSLALCGAGPSLRAEPVEAFLPPSPHPEMYAFSSTAVTSARWALRTADWQVVVHLADPVAAPAAEAVESFLPAAIEPQISAWPAATSLPQFQLPAADWMVANAMAGAAAAPAAQAVESFLPAAIEPQISTWPAATSLPQLQLAPAYWMVATAMADPVAAPAAEAVESFLPAPAEPHIVIWPAVAATLPRLMLGPAAWVLSVDLAELVAAPAAEAVESFLPAAPEPQIAVWPPAAVLLPRQTLEPAEWVVAAAVAEPANAPAAQAVESFLPTAAQSQIVGFPAAAAQLPRLALEAADWVLAAAIAEPANAPAAQAVEAFLPSAKEACALPLLNCALRLPEWNLTAIAPEPVEEFVPPVVIANASENWMPSPPACEAVRDVIPALSGALPSAGTVTAPALASLALGEPAIRWSGNWRQSAKAEPVLSFIAPHLAAALPVSFPVSVLGTGVLRSAEVRRAQNLASPAAEGYLQAAEPPAVDSPAMAASFEQAGGIQVLQFPAFGLDHATGDRAAAFQPGVPSAVEPSAAELHPGDVSPRLASASAVRSSIQAPASPAAILRCGLPLAQPVDTDLICQQTAMAPIKSLASIPAEVEVLAPRFVVRPIFERVEEAVAPPKPVDKTPAFAEIFAISKAARKTSAARYGLHAAGKLIAASLIVGVGMWFGAGSVRISRQMLAVNTSIRGMGARDTSSGTDNVSSAPASGFPTPRNSAPKSPQGPIAAVRRAIQGRAAVELTDTFKRMEAWGSSAMALPAGWTRNPDGYVRSGQLALYGPAQTFTDYHFEFFGQIEKKSMSWAIRARDNQNYYGMKMSVIEPGLRPVVAMVRYAVVGGKKGQRVQTPLSIMMHNNEPYHVSVDVKGNRVVTSIEGQEVDSWTDDALKVGGIGFFSEVGESARLYWMRVSKNQDWLGRVCAYLSSGSGTNTADLWRDEISHRPAQPEPALPPSVDVTLAAAEETEDFSRVGPQRASILKIGRTELCRS
jgi:hypothetical protein